LRAHPEQAQRFADTVDVRRKVRVTHKALFDELMKHLADDKGTELEPNNAEPLPGSANTPGTRLGKASRQAAVALPMNTSLAWATKGQYVSDSPWVTVGHYSDLMTLPSFAIKYVYSKKVDNLADFNEKHTDAQVKASPELQAEKKRLQDLKDRWNAIGDYAGSLSAARAYLAMAGFMGLGEPVLAGMAFTQGTLTLAWVAAQRTPSIFTPKSGPDGLTIPQGVWKAVRWGTIITAVAAPLAQYAWQNWLFPTEHKKDPSLTARGGKALDGWLDSLFADGREFGGPPRPGADLGRPTEQVTDPYELDWPEMPSGQEVAWAVDSDDPDRATFTGMAGAKANRDQQPYNEALDQLFNLNPQWQRGLMDGQWSASAGDPDVLKDGTRINTGVPAG
jgi:hypothetical protein